jgi:protein TonB
MNQRTTLNPAKPLTWIEVEPIKKSRTKKEDDLDSKKQIVQTDKGEIVAKALPDAFLGEHNQVVDRQTVNRKQNITMGSKSKAQPQALAKPLTPPASPVAKTDTHPGSLAHLGLPILPKLLEKAQEPEKDEPQWADQGSTPEDYVKGMTEGDHTALNTKEFVFYGYFQRIRQRLDRAWVPILREKLVLIYKGGRQLASNMDHSTKVLVYLNAEGEITKVKILSESESSELDEAAVRAFNKAGPFPNPPHGMVDASGQIQIPWEFVLKT